MSAGGSAAEGGCPGGASGGGASGGGASGGGASGGGASGGGASGGGASGGGASGGGASGGGASGGGASGGGMSGGGESGGDASGDGASGGGVSGGDASGAERLETPPRRVGFVGLGIMGRPMAANLLEAGFQVVAHSRSPAPVREVVELGAEAAESPADAARRTEVVITMVPDTADVEAVLFGPDGVAEGIRDGGVVIDMSTVSPSATESFARRLAERGADMLDAPVSGGDKGATSATLAIMVGGEPRVFERCRPLLDAMGGKVVHMGPHGSGQRTKLVNQIVGGIHLLALAEALAFARAMGLDAAKVLEVLSSGAAGSWMLTHLGPRALAGDFSPGFMIRLQHKDLRLASEAMQEAGAHLPGAELARELFARAEAEGLGDRGTQALLELYGGCRPAAARSS